jgi:hypothetical protein
MRNGWFPSLSTVNVYARFRPFTVLAAVLVGAPVSETSCDSTRIPPRRWSNRKRSANLLSRAILPLPSVTNLVIVDSPRTSQPPMAASSFLYSGGASVKNLAIQSGCVEAGSAPRT